MTERERLRQELSVLGVKEGDAVLVHSSMKALGTKLSPEEVIDVLQEAVGESGTLLMPALTYENVCGEHKVFDSGTTPPCVGLLPTVFWRQPGVERSLHPHTRSAPGGPWPIGSPWGIRWTIPPWGPTRPLCSWPLWVGSCCSSGTF